MLYFVSTPIGNLKDISLRAIEVLNSVDVIACEDTRKTRILLDHYEIKKQLIRYDKVNEKQSAEGIIQLLNNGKEIAVVSDSGTPVISDPGNILTERLTQENIKYTILPGANAVLSALILSGFNAANFYFGGFIPKKTNEIKEKLTKIKNLDCSLIFYISPHNLLDDLKNVYQTLGKRNACLVGEITKIYEKVIHFKLGDDIDILQKGEFVLVVEGNKNKENNLLNLSVQEHINFYIELGNDEKTAIKLVAKDRKVAKNEIYKQNVSK